MERPCALNWNAPHRPHHGPKQTTVRYKHLTDVQVERCLLLDHAGWSLRGIAKEVGCGHTTVKRVLVDHDYDTFITRKKHPGPARKTTAADDRLLLRVAKKHYNLPFRDIT